MRSQAFISVLLTIPALVHCAKKKSSGEPTGPLKYIFVHGDPMQLVSGTTGSVDSIFAADTPDAFAGFVLASGEVLTQKTEVQEGGPESTSSLEAQNAAASNDKRAVKQVPYSFLADGAVTRYLPVSGKDDLQLEFVTQNGKLVLSKMAGNTVTPIAYSLLAGGEAFSLLFSTNDSVDGTMLVALYFNKQHTEVPHLADVSKDFHFLLGPGVITRWDQDITISLCGQPTADEAETFRTSMMSWASGGQIGTRNLTIAPTTSTVPFSDMNTHCIIMVDDFLFEDVTDAAVLGLTGLTIDHDKQQILAGHIFISRQAFTKIYASVPYLIPDEQIRTATHEFGHFLGLDHEFVKNADGTYKYPSIMSYDPDEYGIQQHDLDAINLLYPTTAPVSAN